LVDDQKHYATILEYLKTGKYDISKPAPIVEWQQDKRKKYYNKRFAEFWIRMGENYSTICDATTMLFQSGNMGRIQLEKTAA
jgi:hypothetical protein